MLKQTTNTLLMVIPNSFEFNKEAFLSNKFQTKPNRDKTIVQKQVEAEFKLAVNTLRENGIEIILHENSKDKQLPDAIFPNNWISTHQSGELLTYPMAVTNRRKERNTALITKLCNERNYKHIDLSGFEKEGLFLEGTGSIVFDHINKKAYACESPRTSNKLFQKVVAKLGYSPIVFKAYGKKNELIYHTNVMLSIGETFVAIGIDTIDENDRRRVLSSFNDSNKKIIELFNDQVYSSFAGNMLQVENKKTEKILVLSNSAYNSLTRKQLTDLKKFNKHLCILNIPTIEKVGGGSARCMLAEIF